MKRLTKHYKFGVDLKEPSTLRGAIIICTVIITSVLILVQAYDAAVAAFLGGMGLVGGVGVAVKDK